MIRSMRLHNFMLYREADLEFSPGVNLIQAKYDEDAAQSNRGGKSTLLEAILFAIYGYARSTRSDVIHRGETQASVTLDTSLGAFAQEPNGGTGFTARYDRPFPLSLKQSLMTWYTQGDSDSIFLLEPAQRKKFLVEILCSGLEEWEALSDRVADACDGLERRVERLRGALQTADVDDLRDRSDAARTELAAVEAELAAARKDVEAADRACSDCAADAERLSRALAVRSRREGAASRMAELTRQLESAREILASAASEAAAIGTGLIPEGEAYVRKVASESGALMERISQLAGRIRRMTDCAEVRCPYTEGVCPVLKPVELLDRLNSEHAEHANALHALERKSSAAVNRLQEMKRVDALRRDAEVRVRAVERAMEDLGSDLPEEFEEETSYEELLAWQQTLAENGAAARVALQSANTRVGGLTVKADELRQRLKSLAASLAARDETERELADAAMAVRGGQALALACSSSGVPARIAARLCAPLSATISDVLSHMGLGFRVALEPFEERTTRERVCSSCGYPYPARSGVTRCPSCGAKRAHKQELAFNLRFSGSTTFLQESTGGRCLADVAARIGLLRVYRQLRGFEWNALVLDEVLRSLDETNRCRMYEFLVDRLPDLGIDQAFVVTHSPVPLTGGERVVQVTKHTDAAGREYSTVV